MVERRLGRRPVTCVSLSQSVQALSRDGECARRFQDQERLHQITIPTPLRGKKVHLELSVTKGDKEGKSKLDVSNPYLRQRHHGREEGLEILARHCVIDGAVTPDAMCKYGWV